MNFEGTQTFCSKHKNKQINKTSISCSIEFLRRIVIEYLKKVPIHPFYFFPKEGRLRSILVGIGLANYSQILDSLSEMILRKGMAE